MNVQNWTARDHKTFLKSIFRSLREARGLSQEALSQKLGYESNVVYKLETGRNQIKWSELIVFLKAIDVPVGPLFEKYFKYKKSLLNLESLFSGLFSDTPLSKIAKAAGLNPKNFKRSVKEANSLDAYIVFFLIAKHFPRFIEFIAEVCHPLIPPEISREHRVRLDFRNLINEKPWVAVLRLYFRENLVCDLDPKNFKLMSAALSQPVKAIAQTVAQLKDKELLIYDEKEKRWMAYQSDLFLSGDPRSIFRQNLYWNKEIMAKQERLLAGGPDDGALTSLTISFSTSPDNLKEVRTLVRNFSSQLRATLNLHSEKNSELCVISLNFAEIGKLNAAD